MSTITNNEGTYDLAGSSALGPAEEAFLEGGGEPGALPVAAGAAADFPSSAPTVVEGALGGGGVLAVGEL
jgi:hypothetical protein